MMLLQILIYPALFFLLMKGAGVSKKNEWNEEALSYKSTKMLQGFAAITIVLHHISQQTCASWLPPENIVHGLDFFVYIGYLMVSVFFLFSGFGMYKGYKYKEKYFDGYFMRRIFPILFIHFLSSSAWAVVRHLKDIQISFATFFDVGGPDMLNPFAWYIVVILYLYVLFYCAFGLIKKEKVSFAVMAAGILLFMLFADYLVYGTWWYTTIPVFFMGLLLGKYEEAIVAFLKKNYIKAGIVFIVGCFVCHELGNRPWILNSIFGGSVNYTVIRLTGIFGLIIASLLFSMLVIMFLLKVSLNNKALAFLGGITLELYLTHGIFVDLFSHHFISINVSPLIYIRNPFFCVAAVLIISIPIAFLLMKLKQLLCDLLNRLIKELTKKQLQENRKKRKIKWSIVFIVLGILIAVYIVRINGNNAKIDEYSKKVTQVTFDNKKMAYYSVGEGKDTVVLLAEDDAPAGLIALRPVADEIAKLDCHVIILEMLGHRFSDDADNERTSQNIAKEIDSALSALGEEGPYVFVALRGSSMYAKQFACDFPGRVKGMVLIDSYVSGMEDELATGCGMQADEFERFYTQKIKWRRVQARFLDFIGYASMYNTAMSEFTYKNNSSKEKEVIAAVSCINTADSNMTKEELMLCDNIKNDANLRIAPDIPVLHMLSYNAVYFDNIAPNWMELHEKQITNRENQSIVVVDGDMYFLYYNWRYAAPKIKGFINGI